MSSCTQDICVDAMRIELVSEQELGEATAMYQGGWRIAFLISQVATFFIASLFDWSAAYIAAAFLMIIIIFLSVTKVPEPERIFKDYVSVFNQPALWFRESYLQPFRDLSKRLKGQLIDNPLTDFVMHIKTKCNGRQTHTSSIDKEIEITHRVNNKAGATCQKFRWNRCQ